MSDLCHNETMYVKYKFLFSIAAIAILPGCALAPFASSVFSSLGTTTMVESTVVNGASYATTGKGISEHVISGVADQDCEFLNLAEGKKVCKDYDLNKIPVKDRSNRPVNSIEDVIQKNNP